MFGSSRFAIGLFVVCCFHMFCFGSDTQKAELGRLREQLSKQWRAVKMSKAAPQSCAASQPGSTAADTGAEPTASAYLVCT